MDDFFKKHNFDVNLKMEKVFYNIVRYFPKIETYEFINVGVIVYKGNTLHYRLISEEELSKLHCPILIESKVLKNSINDLDAFLQEKITVNETVSRLNNRYKNVLDTSFQLSYATNEEIDVVVSKLFNKFIGYKLIEKKQKIYSEKFIDETISLVQKEFNAYLSVKQSKISGFNLDFFNKKSSLTLHSLIGSINNSYDLFKAFNGVPVEVLSNEKYNFLHSVTHNPSLDNIEKLKRNNISVYKYSNEDEIYNYCKIIAEK